MELAKELQEQLKTMHAAREVKLARTQDNLNNLVKCNERAKDLIPKVIKKVEEVAASIPAGPGRDKYLNEMAGFADIFGVYAEGLAPLSVMATWLSERNSLPDELKYLDPAEEIREYSNIWVGPTTSKKEPNV